MSTFRCSANAAKQTRFGALPGYMTDLYCLQSQRTDRLDPRENVRIGGKSVVCSHGLLFPVLSGETDLFDGPSGLRIQANSSREPTLPPMRAPSYMRGLPGTCRVTPNWRGW